MFLETVIMKHYEHEIGDSKRYTIHGCQDR